MKERERDRGRESERKKERKKEREREREGGSLEETYYGVYSCSYTSCTQSLVFLCLHLIRTLPVSRVLFFNFCPNSLGVRNCKPL